MKTTFFTIAPKEKRSGHVVVDVYMIRAQGQPQKIDRLMPTLKNFSRDALKKYLFEKYGNGAFQLRHHNKGRTGYTVEEIILTDEKNKGSISAITDQDRIDELYNKIKDLENANFELRARSMRNESDLELTRARIEKTKIEGELIRRREEIEIKRAEAELESEIGRKDFMGIVQDILKDKDHPLHALVHQGAQYLALMLQQKKAIGK